MGHVEFQLHPIFPGNIGKQEQEFLQGIDFFLLEPAVDPGDADHQFPEIQDKIPGGHASSVAPVPICFIDTKTNLSIASFGVFVFGKDRMSEDG